MINFFECVDIVDDDQAIVCQIYKKYSEYFDLYNAENNWFKFLSIYGININNTKSIDTLDITNINPIDIPNINSIDTLNNSNIVSNNKNIKIAFHDSSLCIRGTTIALYDYAYYNKKLYGNESIIFYNKNNSANDEDVIKKFEKEFKVYSYNDFSEVDDILLKENINYLYSINHGYIKDSLLSNVAKNLIHAIFNIEPHGYRYACISQLLADNHFSLTKESINVVPHMVNIDTSITDNFREKLSIPKEAIVIGRHGGYEQFNIIEAFEAIKQILEIEENIYFVFVNTKIFYVHPRIIYLNKIVDLIDKVKFINTCDAMIHARIDGETFGLAIAEFSVCNKPIITCKTPGNNCHIDMLKDKGLYYYDTPSLINIFKNIKLIKELNYDWNVYKEYSPEKVMDTFMNIFIN
jgi:hypothetical protein